VTCPAVTCPAVTCLVALEPLCVAEASWVVFDPLVTNSSLWTIDVLGNLISPLNVIENGTRHVHSSWGGALLNDTVSGEAVHILRCVSEWFWAWGN
jgi:hypothetical protein